MKVLLFADNYGAPLALRYLPTDCLVGIVGASVRPQYHGLLADLASAAGVPFVVQPRRTDAAYQRFLATTRALKPELLLVNSYSMRLGEDVLALASLGGVNVHSALLPRYRGANPIQWALIHNETETGVTMHCLTRDFDAGDVIAQRRVPIQLTDTWIEVQARIAGAAEDLLHAVLPGILEGRLEGTPQDERVAQHYPRRTAEDGRIDWRQSVLRTYNLVRALVRPHPGAFYEVGGIRHVLDTYTSLAEITAIKARLGVLPLLGDKVLMTPVTEEPYPLDSVWFAVSDVSSAQPIGAVGLDDIEYHTRTAQFRFQGTTIATNALRNVARWVTAYAFDELELSRLNVDANAGHLLDQEDLTRTINRSTHAERRPSSGAPRASGC